MPDLSDTVAKCRMGTAKKFYTSIASLSHTSIAPRHVAGTPAPYSPTPARTPGVYAQRLYARTHTSGRTKSVQDAPTTNDHDCTDAEPIKHTQPFTGERGFRQGCRNKDTPSFARGKAIRVS